MDAICLNICHHLASVGVFGNIVPSSSSRVDPKVDLGASDAEPEPKDRFHSPKNKKEPKQNTATKKKQAPTQQPTTTTTTNRQKSGPAEQHQYNFIIYIYIREIIAGNAPGGSSGALTCSSGGIRSGKRGGWMGWADRDYGSYGRGRFDVWIFQYGSHLGTSIIPSHWRRIAPSNLWWQCWFPFTIHL